MRSITIFIRFLLLLIALSFAVSAVGKSYPISIYSVDNGLPSNVVYDICQDSKGFLWFATDKGIARYNGVKFETFTTYNGLPDNEVFVFCEDHERRLWLVTYSGKLAYYKDDKFYSEAQKPFLRLPFKGPMTFTFTLEQDSSLTIYFAESAAIVSIRHQHTSIYYLDKINKKNLGKNICAVKRITANNYEIIYPGKTVRIDTNTNILSETKNRWDDIAFLKKGVQGYFIAGDSIYNDSFKVLCPAIKKSSSGLVTFHIFSDKRNNFISTNYGLFLNGIKVLHQPVACVNKDNYGNYWIATLGSGVYMLDKAFQTTGFYKSAYKGVARFAKAEKGSLFIAVQDKSLYKLTKEYTECLFDATEYINERSATLRNAYLIDGNTYYAFGNGNNFIIKDIWSEQPKLMRFKIKNQEYARDIFIHKPYIFFTTRANLFYSKISDIGRNKPQIQIITGGKKEPLYARAQSTEGDIWYSTLDKVYKISDQKPVIQKQLGSISFRSFEILGKYLVGYTHDNQLLICNNFETDISIDTVIGENCIWDKFYKLNDSSVLLSTNSQYRILTLYSSKGVPRYSICALEIPYIPLHAECIAADGYDCFFLKDGCVTRVRTETLLEKSAAPTLLSAVVKTKTKVLALDSVLYISYDDARNISLSFAAPSFNGKVSYEYQITKNHTTDSWHPLSGEDIQLYGLGYGRYTIKARAKTASSKYSVPVIFTLVVRRPFWAEWWFLLPSGAVACILIWLAVHYRVKRVLKGRERVHQSEIKFLRSEYKALSALMNPHFIFNAMNSVQWLINSDEKLSASEYLHTFSDLVRQNMQNVSDEIVSLQKELMLVENYLKLEKLRFKDFLTYKISIEESIEAEEIMIPPLLIQPLVENAIKHGLFPRQSIENYVHINIYEQYDLLRIEVHDNGVGMQHATSRETVYRPVGLDNIRKRLEQLASIHAAIISFEISEIVDAEGKIEGTLATITIDTESFSSHHRS